MTSNPGGHLHNLSDHNLKEMWFTSCDPVKILLTKHTFNFLQQFILQKHNENNNQVWISCKLHCYTHLIT